MDISSAHVPYVMSAFAVAGGIFAFLTFWALQADRKVRRQLAKWKSDAT